MRHLDRAQLSGRLDVAAFAAFSHGACEAFAVALHDATQWPLVKITDPWNVSGPCDRWGVGIAGGGSGVHWACRDDAGLLVDIQGRHPVQELTSSFDSYVDTPTDEDEEQGITAGAKAGYASRAEALEENEAKSGNITVADAVPYVQLVLQQLHQD